jgi:hypothetical protein
MKNRGWLSHRAGGMPGGAHRKSPTRAIRAWAARGALAVAVAAGGAGAVVAATAGHGSAGHIQSGAHHRTGSVAVSVNKAPNGAVTSLRMPWMY